MPHFLILLLLAGTARADDGTDVAKRAAETADTYCVDNASGNVQIAANALIPVGGSWAEVDEAWQASREASLLYWRGRLAQCLEKDERALADFAAFIEAKADDPDYVQQVEDARRRMRFLHVGDVEEAPAGPGVATRAGIGIGVGLGGAAGALTGLGIWQHTTANAAIQRYQSGDLTRGQFADVRTEIDQSGAAANALLGVSAGLAAGAVVAIVASAALTPRKARAGGVSVRPTGAGIEVRW
jgi:hypothetical protein